MYATCGGKGVLYRPTFDSCVMRQIGGDLSEKSPCPVCLEQFWIRILAKINFLDNFTMATSPDKKVAKASLQLLDILHPISDHFRGTAFVGTPERYSILWYKNGLLVEKFIDQREWTEDYALAKGKWKVRVRLLGHPIRKDPGRLATKEVSFSF